MATDKHRSLAPNIGKSTPVLACSERFAVCESDVSTHKGQKQHTCLQASFIATELVSRVDPGNTLALTLAIQLSTGVASFTDPLLHIKRFIRDPIRP